MLHDELRFYPGGDRAIEVELGDGMDFTVHRQVAAVREARIAAIKDLIPELASFRVNYDPDWISHEDLTAEIAACIYPDRTPGGYQLIDRSPAPIYDGAQRLPAFRDSLALFRAGDRVRFRPVTQEVCAQIEAEVAADHAGCARTDDPPGPAPPFATQYSGREFGFAHRAIHENSDHGQEPSDIIDHGYPLGAVNLAGQTPIILVNDAPGTGGFINPFTVASAALWKLARARHGDILRFRRIDRAEAGRLRAELGRVTSPGVTALA